MVRKIVWFFSNTQIAKIHIIIMQNTNLLTYNRTKSQNIAKPSSLDALKEQTNDQNHLTIDTNTIYNDNVQMQTNITKNEF